MVSEKIQKSLDSWVEAWRNLDVDAIMDLVSDKIQWEDSTSQKTYTSREELRAHFVHAISGMKNVKLTIHGNYGNETDFAASEWTMIFDYYHQTEYLHIPAKGQEIKTQGVTLRWFDADGKIVNSKDYGKLILPEKEGD